MHWRRKWQPTPVFLPGESQGRGSLVGCRLYGRIESDRTEVTYQQQQQQFLEWTSNEHTTLWNIVSLLLDLICTGHCQHNLLISCGVFMLQENSICYWKNVEGPAAHLSKASRQSKLVERKVCFISDASRWCREEDGHLSKGWFPPSGSHWSKSFYRQKEGTYAETAQSVQTVIFKLIICGLTSMILVVLGTVNLQFQVHLFPFFWGQFSELWQLMSWIQSVYYIVNFFPLVF